MFLFYVGYTIFSAWVLCFHCFFSSKLYQFLFCLKFFFLPQINAPLDGVCKLTVHTLKGGWVGLQDTIYMTPVEHINRNTHEYKFIHRSELLSNVCLLVIQHHASFHGFFYGENQVKCNKRKYSILTVWSQAVGRFGQLCFYSSPVRRLERRAWT